jgi:beta-lactamase class A
MVLYILQPSHKQSLIVKKPLSPLPSITPINSPSPVQDPRIAEAVTAVLKTRKGEYGVYYKDVKTGYVYEKNSHEIFYSASLYKLWVMGEVFRQIDEGKLKKEEELHKSVPALNQEFGIASEEADLAEGDVDLTVDDALENMITVSSNYAALLLSDRLKTVNIADFLKMNGFTDSSFGSPPKTSPHDIGTLFEKLYNHQLVAPVYTKEMIAILSRQQINDRLPKYLPESVEVAHKTGELYGYHHDAGIIFAPSGAYILAVLSKSDDEKYAAETIALISQEVYRVKEEK